MLQIIKYEMDASTTSTSTAIPVKIEAFFQKVVSTSSINIPEPMTQPQDLKPLTVESYASKLCLTSTIK